jgi:hypothetical protein
MNIKYEQTKFKFKKFDISCMNIMDFIDLKIILK